MKYLLLILFTFSLIIAGAQNNNFEVGMYASGSYKYKSRFNSKKILYLSPEILRNINNYQLGIGFSFEGANNRYNKNYISYINQKNEYLSRTTRKIGLRIIGRRLVPLASDRWKLIVGIDVYGMKSTGNYFQIDLENSDKEIKAYHVGLRHYGGIKFQPNDKWSFNAYMDLLKFSYEIEQKPSKYNYISVGPDLDITKGFDFIKLGFSYKL